MPASDEAVFRTVKWTMRHLGVGKTSIYELIKAGKLKKVLVGPRRGARITQESIDEYVAETTRGDDDDEE